MKTVLSIGAQPNRMISGKILSVLSLLVTCKRCVRKFPPDALDLIEGIASREMLRNFLLPPPPNLRGRTKLPVTETIASPSCFTQIDMKTEQEGTSFRDRFTHVTCGTIGSLIEIAQVHNWIIFIKSLVDQYVQDAKLIQILSKEEIVS